MELYAKLALHNMKENRRLFLPQILTNGGLMTMFFIIYTLMKDERIRKVKGGDYLPTIMAIGIIVVILITVILIFYINSFLMKQRKSEFGLYNVLGLEKKHINKILFVETSVSALSSIIIGSVFGLLFYKLCTLLICNIIHINTILGFDYLQAGTLIPTIIFFLILYALTFIFNVISIARMKPMELLKSKNAGEKEPKVKWLILIIGILTLGIGYYLALSVESPLAALSTFFIAVPLVIVGTYCLFITGSIALLKLLKKKTNYFYTNKHMISVSGLIYRMKQNAVGLASISILATCVIIMVSTTVSLYSGIDDSVKTNFAHDMNISCIVVPEGGSYSSSSHSDNAVYLDEKTSCEIVAKAAAMQDAEVTFAREQEFASLIYFRDGKNYLNKGFNDSALEDYKHCSYFYVITEETYTHLTDLVLNLGDHEIAAVDMAVTNKNKNTEEFSFNGDIYKVTHRLKNYPVSSQISGVMEEYFGIVVSDQATYDKFLNECQPYESAYTTTTISYDFSQDSLDYELFEKNLDKLLNDYTVEKYGENAYSISIISSRWSMSDEMYRILGSLLFLGFILAIVFMFATVLTIYYKQISEGYGDRNNFQILQKVGLSQTEVKKTIKDQILIVFFLPLIVAGVHIAVAFPILLKLLSILFLSSSNLFLICTLISFAAFAIIYAIIYVITSNVYYRIIK